MPQHVKQAEMQQGKRNFHGFCSIRYDESDFVSETAHHFSLVSKIGLGSGSWLLAFTDIEMLLHVGGIR